MILLFGVFLLIQSSVAKGSSQCVESHAFNEETGLCDWTGPQDACIELVDYWNRSWFMSMPNFPKTKWREVDLKATGEMIDDFAIKVIVRRGCMFTGYTYQATGDANQEARLFDAWISPELCLSAIPYHPLIAIHIPYPGTPQLSSIQIKVAENLVYGAHKLPNYMNQGVGLHYLGLTRPFCVCDPTEATVNGHVPSPPADRKCIDHHEFNETTQQCEWKLDSKFCAELHTSDNRKQLLEIPNWPTKRKYDVNHWDHKRNENFHVTVTNIIVRQHCFASAYFWAPFQTWKTLPIVGYGYHTVASSMNGLTNHANSNEGSARFVCECIR